MMLTNQTPVAVMSGKTLTQNHDSLAAFVRSLVKQGVISKKCKQFLLACFTKEPIARPSVSDLLGHDWLKEEVSSGMQSPDAISRAGGKTWVTTLYNGYACTRSFAEPSSFLCAICQVVTLPTSLVSSNSRDKQ